jgi:hypothetical protein
MLIMVYSPDESFDAFPIYEDQRFREPSGMYVRHLMNVTRDWGDADFFSLSLGRQLMTC